MRGISKLSTIMTRSVTFLLLCYVGMLQTACSNQSKTVCDCVNDQVKAMENGGDEEVTLGLCSYLTDGKTEKEIEQLNAEFKNCPGYEKIEVLISPITNSIMENLESKDSTNTEFESDLLDAIKNVK